MSSIYGYANELWKVIHNFEYTGQGVGFTLSAGKYLLICKGGNGGITSTVPNASTIGGIAYGILTLTDPSTQLFAYVGGNGGDSLTSNNTPGIGGFNGGGNGGHAIGNRVAGAGGGGASDIRIGTDSLYTRVIVAGGGGGGLNNTNYINYFTSDSGNNYCSFGGGPVGGPVISSNKTEDPNCYVYATQIDGYSFGQGMNGIDRTKSRNGPSGGGGGWFGGFSCYMNPDVDTDSFASNGGGGSGYVLTSESYKPEGYLLDEKYYLTDIFMNCGCSDNACVIVCELTNSIEKEDILYFPSVNKKTRLLLPSGQYRLKCYGGNGGTRHLIENSSKGGYAEGVLTIESGEDIYVYTGGSGLSNVNLFSEQSADTFGNLYNTSRSFNGGGDTNHRLSGTGGGASDIRIGTDSLYARVIVAGGAGGIGYRVGGLGGGLEGTSSTSGYGTCPGAGTQITSPQDLSYPEINGGFGYGGNGVFINNGYGGAGGGGWFGGSGCYPNSSADNEKGGAGGSGYVLTSESYKPEGYLLDEKYYLTDTVLTTGGNNLITTDTLVKIEVININNDSKMLCYDNEGYKYFNESQNKWVYLTDSIPTKEQFEQYASYKMTTDEGLLDDYEIIIYDENDIFDSVRLNVVPSKQKISIVLNSNISINKIITDAEFNHEIYDLEIKVKHKGVGIGSKLQVDTYINKKIQSDEKFKLYCVELSSSR